MSLRDQSIEPKDQGQSCAVNRKHFARHFYGGHRIENATVVRDPAAELKRRENVETGRLLSRPRLHVTNKTLSGSDRETLRQIRRRRYLGDTSCKDAEPSRELASSENQKRVITKPLPLEGKAKSETHQPIPKPLEGKKVRLKRDPLPMSRRALPLSFFKEPKSMNTSSLAGSFYSVLPPLFPNNETCEEVIERPVTPPDEKVVEPQPPKKACMTSPPDTELLFSLFDHLENKVDSRLIVKRGRPKKQAIEKPPPPPPRCEDQNPCMVDALSEKLFPKLSLNGATKSGQEGPLQVELANYTAGSRTVEFPAIQPEQNFSAMLNELVTHM